MPREVRNMPHVNATLYRQQDETIKQMAKSAGMKYSRVLREIVDYALRRGYTPGSVTVADIRHEAREHSQRRPA